MAKIGFTPDEFEERFDVLYNNITSNQAPGLNTYEKSVLLTKAQDEILKNYFTANSKGNNLGQGFDDSAKRQIDFSMLTAAKSDSSSQAALFDTREESKSVAIPDDAMMIINEIVQVDRVVDGHVRTVDLAVLPIRFDEYNRLMAKPYKRPVKNQAWRLINNSTANRADIVVGPKDRFIKYIVRYIRKPKPIIIGELDGLTINGFVFGTSKSADPPQAAGCELDGLLHEEILQRAVELAKISWTQTGQDNAQLVMQAGQRSE